jgi:bifunctional non-homologous end joining protein LigD
VYIDGELCAVDENGITSFSLLQAATDNGLTASRIFFAFDLLYLDGENLMSAPLANRKQQPQRLLERVEGPIRYCYHQVGLGPRFY